MYRILLVDDEPLILAGIESMIEWEKYGCIVADKATNGQNALKKIEELQPDIVITDIKMPVMDGIALMEACRDRGYDPVFVLLTNLEEFSIAKSAISLGALDYLVKIEITPELMGKSVVRAVKACSQRMMLKKPSVPGALFQENTEKMTELCFRELLENGETGEESGESDRRWAGIEALYANSVLAMILPYKAREELFQEEQKSGREELMNYAEKLFRQFMNRVSSVYCMLRWEKKGFLVILSGSHTEDGLADIGKKLSQITEDYFGCACMTAFSRLRENVRRGLPKAFQGLLQAKDWYYAHSESGVVFTEEVQRLMEESQRGQHEVFDINFLKKDLRQALTNLDREKIEAVFCNVADLFAEYRPSKKQVLNASANLYYFLFSYMETEMQRCGRELMHPAEVIRRLEECVTLEENIQWIRDLGKWAAKQTDLFRGGSRTDKIVENVKRYILKNYSEKLTLSLLSSQIGISQGYLSSVFKKQTGSNLVDYINQVKIEKAKEILALNQYMMYEISDMLGFENPYYFSKVFKKFMGMTPSEYEMNTKLSQDETRG